MLHNFTLAQSAEALSETGENPIFIFNGALTGRLDALNHPEHLLSALSDIHPVWAVIFVIVGALSIVHGYRWHKPLVLVLSALLGVGAGTFIGEQIGGAHAIAAASTSLLFVVLALPGLKFAVALFGGLAGAFAGANAWTAFGGDPSLHHMGSVIGLIVLGMLAFMTFRVVIVLFTSIGGTVFLLFGALALMLRVESWQNGIASALETKPLILPMIAIVIACVGVVLQLGGGFKGLNAAADRADPKKAAAKPA